jgi:hypothetical protein
MQPIVTNRWTGITGIALYLLILFEIPLYFVYTPTAEGTPPENIILSRILVDLFVCIGLLGFFSGFRTIISKSCPDYEWLGTFIFSCGIALAIVAFVADSIQAGGTWLANGSAVNPTAVGQGADGALLIYGPINRMLMVCMSVAGGFVILKTGILPRWTGLFALVAGLYNAAFIPTLYFMTTPLDFYSVNGWNIPIAAGVFFLWILVMSVYLLRRERRIV